MTTRRSFITAGLASLALVALPTRAHAATTAEKLAAMEKSRNRYRAQSRRYRWAHLKHHDRWSKTNVEWALSEACRKYGIKGDDRAWLIGAGLRVAWGESRYNTKAHRKGSAYRGLFQFGDSWGSAAHRFSGRWSVHRFARVFRDGGRDKIRQHWRATVGGW